MANPISEDIQSVKLISSDDSVFVVERKVALASGTIKNMLSSPGLFTETVKSEIRFADISGIVLEKIVKYLHYKVEHENSLEAIPEFPIESELAMELLTAADYLDC